MTGPEHYIASEELLHQAERSNFPETAHLLCAQAQVHATLALTVAVVAHGVLPADHTAWSEATSRVGGDSS